jgi:hypothetical protein
LIRRTPSRYADYGNLMLPIGDKRNMCGSAHACGDVPDGWIGGFYQLYPVEEILPDLSDKWTNINLERISEVFPERLEAYCVLAFILAMGDAEEKGEWVGATYPYLDRLAVGYLRREHAWKAWKRLGKWILSFGRSNELTRTDLFILLMPSFTQFFWSSMKSLIFQGCVRVEEREIDETSVGVFFPTARLISKMNCSLSD